jgi:hypothetical protein
MLQPAARIATRATNAQAHPGKAIPKQKRRSKAEMQQDREIEAEKKQEKEQRKASSLKKIAKLETQMAIDDAKAKETPEGRRLILPKSPPDFRPLWADDSDEDIVTDPATPDVRESFCWQKVKHLQMSIKEGQGKPAVSTAGNNQLKGSKPKTAIQQRAHGKASDPNWIKRMYLITQSKGVRDGHA